MKLFDRLSTAVRAAASAAAHDLFGEESYTPEDQTAALLAKAQKRVGKLNEQLAQAVAREKRAEQEWRAALAQATTLDVETNAAAQSGQDDLARAKLAQLKQTQLRAQQLGDGYRIYAGISEKLRIEIGDMQAQLDGARQRLDQVGQREQGAAGMEDLQQQRREQRKDSAAVHDDLKAREEQTAQREDHIAAREDLDSTRIADLLSKRGSAPDGSTRDDRTAGQKDS